MTVTILRTSGLQETHELERGDLAGIRRLIDCATIDTVTLSRNSSGAVRVMIVDDDGYDVEVIDHGLQPDPRVPGGMTHVWERKPVRARKPINLEATRLYHEARGINEHFIVGDVAIVDDREFGDD